MNSRVGTTFGKYKITRLLGKGGMGEVYAAHDTEQDRVVALKILPEEYSHDERYRARFQRESHAAAILQEPHVIPIHTWGEIDGNLYIDMRLVDGDTLHDLINKGPLEPSRAVAIIDQIAAALDAAHAKGLIHRDIKPQNIIVTWADFAYLVDFGIAETKGDARLTMAGTQIGSFAYMAPERFNDEEATPAVDTYALACVLYEALTGLPPFPTDSMEHLIASHLSSARPRPSAFNAKVPATFDDVIARGMAKEPDDRYGSAGALGRAAQRALQTSGPVDAPNANTMPAPPMSSPRVPVSTDPQYGAPSTGPTEVLGQRRRGEREGRWVLPTAIAVAAALLLGSIGVVIGLLARQNPAPTPPSASPAGVPSAPPYQPLPQQSPQAQPPQQQLPQLPPAPPPPPRQASAARPPLVLGPDQSTGHDDCDEGYSLTNVTGFGTNAGRGTAETSCYFARSVLLAYWNTYGNASQAPRAVSTPGAVDCDTVPGALCNGTNFLMQCVEYSGDNWITCTGGNNARVYLF